jgi:hypothetical protein
MNRFVAWITALIMLVPIIIMSTGCSTPNSEGFAIYLTKGNISPGKVESLAKLEPAEQPFIGINDIVTYNADSHELKLAGDAYTKIYELQVPTTGTTFVVCVDKKPIYWGAFWTPISSQAFDGVTIWKPFLSERSPVVTIELGYPAPSFYGGEDPRNKPEIIDSLKKSGKLIEKMTIATINRLPASMKGYELYSWYSSGQWHYTLITGTNRNKTQEEIVSAPDSISETGWINIHVIDIDSLKTVLAKIPQNEFVTWLGYMRDPQGLPDNITFDLPPIENVNDIRDFAKQCGFQLSVTVP